MARLYRACELLAQLVLLRDFRQQTNNIEPDRLPLPAGREFRARYGTEDGPGDLKGLLGSRNSSLLAHGVDPIREDKARELLEHVTALARVVDPAIVEAWLAKAELVRFRAF